MLIKVFSKYVKETKDKDAILILPGNGDNYRLCVELAEKEGIISQVLFPGLCSKEKLLTYYDKANILLCSSISETYCQSIVEGLCLGKCIITTPVGVATEIINENNGFIFNTADELYQILKYLRTNNNMIPIIGKYNYEKGRCFSWNNIVHKYDRIINNI